MAGDERQLRYEMLDAAVGRKPDSSFWDRPQASDSYFSGQGSQNIWLMRAATKVLMNKDEEVPWEAVYHYQLGPPPGSVLVARNGSPQLIPVAERTANDRVYPPGFGGSEFMSTIYWVWHLMSHVALMKKGGEIGDKARRWVVLNWVLFRAIQAHDGSLLLFGQRSAGHNPIPREPDWLFALASGGDLKRAEKWCKKAGAGLKRSWEFAIGNALKGEMQSTWQEASTLPLETLQSLPLRVPTEIICTEEGLAVVHATRCNSNTPPILAGTFWRNGRRDILPTSDVKGVKVPGGIRIRQKADEASARIEGNEIVYKSSLYTGGAEQRIPLPGGAVIYHLKLGGVSAGPVTEPEPEPVDPVDPPPPIEEPEEEPPFPDLLHAADLIAQLQLPNKMQSTRAQIVAKLRSREVDDDDLADIVKQVRDFRIHPQQVQAAKVEEAIEILERS